MKLFTEQECSSLWNFTRPCVCWACTVSGIIWVRLSSGYATSDYMTAVHWMWCSRSLRRHSCYRRARPTPMSTASVICVDICQRHRSVDHCSLGLHRISYPALAPAEIRPNFYIRPYPAPAGYGCRIWGRIWPSFDVSASLCNWAGIHCYKFGNLHLSVSSWGCGSYPHPHFRLYFIAGCIVTLCDVA